MPTPVHIICSQSGVEDKTTGLVSAFHIFEKLLIGQMSTQGALPLVQMRISATWMREDRDRDREFQFETGVLIPGIPSIFEAGRGTFFFSNDFQRLTSLIWGPLPILEPGLMLVQNRIRIVGDDAWAMQQCPIIIERAAPPDNAVIAPNN